MARFISVKHSDGTSSLVNLDNVLHIGTEPNGKTVFYMKEKRDVWCSEPFSKIEALIKAYQRGEVNLL